MTGALLDRPTDEDDDIRRRLRSAPVVWLGTVTPLGAPRSVPVWFLWDDPRILIFSAAGSQKLASIAANPRVWLHLDSDDGGNDVVLIEGTAEVLERGASSAAATPGFVEKYGDRMAESPQAWSEAFPIPIVVTAHRLVAWSKPASGPRHRVAVQEPTSGA